MSGSFNNLLFKYNTLATQLLVISKSLFQFVTLNTIQTITSLKIFVIPPKTNFPPVSPNDLVNKQYVDSIMPTPVARVFQKRILNVPFSGNIDTLIQLDSPVLGLCQISARMELTPNQSINIGDVFLKIKDGSTVLANSLSQVNFQGLVAGELATAQISCMDVISTNAQMTFTLNNIAGTTAPYGTYSLFLDIIKM
jgi:hypothetical protein